MKKSIIFILLVNLVVSAYSQNDSIKIGAKYKGGIIFQVDESGNHGLIAAPYDQSKELMPWGKNGQTRAKSMTDGKANTELIVRHAKVNNMPDKFAACLCDSLTIGGFTDWYLPALDELKELYINKTIVPNIRLEDYTSSTEVDGQDAWSMHFKREKPVFHYNKNDKNYNVRCIRKF